MTAQQSLCRFLLIALPITLIWLIYNAINHRPLGFDEAQYWAWSQHLQWGYHSKPPIIAGMIRLTTTLFGQSEFAVRASVPVCNFLTALLIYQMARLSYGHHTALWSGITFLCLPIVFLSSSLITTDPFMMLFWALGLYGIIRFIHTGNVMNWLLIGVGAGLSIMSKYTGLFFLLSLLLCGVFIPHCRIWLRKWYFYGAMLLAALLFLPNLMWNIDHGLQTFKHVTYHNANVGHWRINPLHVLGFFGQQFVAFSVILFPALVISLIRIKQTCRSIDDTIFLSFTLPVLTALLLQSFMARTDANWTAPAYIAATPWIVNTLRQWQQQHWLKINLLISAIAILVFYSVELSATHFTITPLKQLPPYRKIMAWGIMKTQLQTFTQQHPHACYLFNSRKTWGPATYYGQLTTHQVYFWKADDNYDIDTSTRWANNPSCEFYFIGSDLPADMKSYFSKVKLVKTIDGTIDPHYPAKLSIYQLGRLETQPFTH